MAESSESAPKANEFLLGVVDLFGIVLPGALTSVIVAVSSGLYVINWSHPPGLNTTQWVVFIVVSYIVGHLISGLGGMMLDPLYDGFYPKRFVGEIPRLRRRAERAAHKVLGNEFYREDDNRLEWAETLIRLTNSNAAAHVDRLEADSKFFRSLAVMLVMALPALLALLSKEKASLGLWLIWAFVISSLVLWSRFKYQGVADRGGIIDKQIKEQLNDLTKDRLAWPDEQWFKIEARVAEKEAKQCRTQACKLAGIWASVMLLVSLLAFMLWCRSWCVGLGIGIAYLSVLSFVLLRFVALRGKRTRLTYRYAILAYRLMVAVEHTASPSAQAEQRHS